MEFLRVLYDNLILEILPLVGFALYVAVSKLRPKGTSKVRHSNRVTSRTSEYYSTEIDEL